MEHLSTFVEIQPDFSPLPALNDVMYRRGKFTKKLFSDLYYKVVMFQIWLHKILIKNFPKSSTQ